MDPNKEERVGAYLEARRLRAIVAARAPEIIEFSLQDPYPKNPPPTPVSTPHTYHKIPNQNFTEASVARNTDYPTDPDQNSGGIDPIAERFKYKIDDSHIQRTANDGLSHNRQLEEYRNKVKWNNHTSVDPREKFMTWQTLCDKIDVEDQEELGKMCLKYSNEFRKSQGKSHLEWEPTLFNIGRIIITDSSSAF